MDENWTAIIVAAIAMLSSMFSAFLNFRASRTATENKEAAAKDKELREAREKIAKQEQEQYHAETQRKFDEIREMMDRNFQEMKKDMDTMHTQINEMRESFQKLERKTDIRIANQEERMRAIVDVLSRNARTFSAMMKMHAQADSRMATIMEVSSYNLKVAQETSSAIQVIGEILCEVAEDNDTVSETDMGRLQHIVGNNTIMQQQFTDKILAAQASFFNQPGFSPDPATDKEVENIREIMSIEKHDHSNEEK